jgi:excisionase family DNA binding protein
MDAQGSATEGHGAAEGQGVRGCLGIRPIQKPTALDNRGMKRKASPAFFTERSLAAYLTVSDRTIRNWIRRGELPSYKLGAARRIDPVDVDAFLAARREETS